MTTTCQNTTLKNTMKVNEEMRNTFSFLNEFIRKTISHHGYAFENEHGIINVDISV